MSTIIAGVIGAAIVVMLVRPGSPAAKVIDGFFNVLANLARAVVSGGS